MYTLSVGATTGLIVDKRKVGDGFVVSLSGVIDADFKAEALADDLSGPLVIDFDAVSRITSFGVREWVKALRIIDSTYVAFVRCRPAIVAQFNMVTGFAGGGDLLSFYAPYLCEACDHAFEDFVDVRRQYDKLSAFEAPDAVCPQCGEPAEFDDFPEEYFDYIAGHPVPQPPAMVRRMLGGSTDGGDSSKGRLKFEKEVDGVVTALWLSGVLHAESRLKRALQGLEGAVVVELSGLSQANMEGLRLLDSILGGQGLTEVRYARVSPQSLQLFHQCASTDESLTPIASLLWPASAVDPNGGCDACRGGTELEIDLAMLRSMDADGLVVGNCARCHMPISGRFTAPQRDMARELVAGSSAVLRGYLRKRLPREPLSSAQSTSSREEIRLHRLWAEKYQRTRRLGSGGMAEIYVAKQRGPEGFTKDVVIKRVLPSRANNHEIIQMFLQEAQLAVRINHPNVVHLFDLGRDGNDFFIAMEYVDGWDLWTVLRESRNRERPLPIAVTCRIISDACAGLHAAHATVGDHGQPLGIIHRDVSPPNVLLSAEGTVKITDFGVATAVRALVETRPGIVKGKVSYLAPEQVMGPQDAVTHQADIFALGIVLYECIAGRNPFRRRSEYDTMSAIRKGKFPPLGRFREDVPEALEQIVAKALTVDPAERYLTANEMQMDLERLLVSMGSPTTSTQVGAFLQELLGEAQRGNAAGGFGAETIATERTDEDLIDDTAETSEITTSGVNMTDDQSDVIDPDPLKSESKPG